MPTEQEYEEAIAAYDAPQLVELWEEVQQSEEDDFWEDGKAFEYLIIRAFEIEGARVRWPYRVSLGNLVVEQIDGVVHFDHFSCVIEAKSRGLPNEAINGDAVGKLHYILARRPTVTIGSVFTRTTFTQPAIMMALMTVPQRVLLWNNMEIDYCLRYGAMLFTLREKFRFLVEEGVGLYNVLGDVN
jgi:hypothetical protein